MKRLITKETDYALRVLIYLQKSDSPISLHYLCQELYINRPMLIKIMQKLKSIEFIFTKKGKNGGIILNRKYIDMSLFEILYKLKNYYDINNCNNFNGNICNLKHRCNASKIFEECKIFLDQKFQNIKLKDLNYE